MTEEKKGFPLRVPKSLLEFLAKEAQNANKSTNQHVTEILTGYKEFQEAEARAKK